MGELSRGWHPDPQDDRQYRWHDGERFTEFTCRSAPSYPLDPGWYPHPDDPETGDMWFWDGLNWTKRAPLDREAIDYQPSGVEKIKSKIPSGLQLLLIITGGSMAVVLLILALLAASTDDENQNAADATTTTVAPITTTSTAPSTTTTASDSGQAIDTSGQWAFTWSWGVTEVSFAGEITGEGSQWTFQGKYAGGGSSSWRPESGSATCNLTGEPLADLSTPGSMNCTVTVPEDSWKGETTGQINLVLGEVVKFEYKGGGTGTSSSTDGSPIQVHLRPTG